MRAGITEEMYEKFLKQLTQARAMAEVGEAELGRRFREAMEAILRDPSNQGALHQYWRDFASEQFPNFAEWAAKVMDGYMAAKEAKGAEKAPDVDYERMWALEEQRVKKEQLEAQRKHDRWMAKDLESEAFWEGFAGSWLQMSESFTGTWASLLGLSEEPISAQYEKSPLGQAKGTAVEVPTKIAFGIATTAAAAAATLLAVEIATGIRLELHGAGGGHAWPHIQAIKSVPWKAVLSKAEIVRKHWSWGKTLGRFPWW